MTHSAKQFMPRDPPESENSILFAQFQHDVCGYLAESILALREMAKAAKLFRILVPLEFAYYEAFSIENRVDAPRKEAKHKAKVSEVKCAISTLAHPSPP